MNKTLYSKLAGVLLISFIVLSGCGESGSSADEPALSKAAYLKRADAFCQKAETEQLKLILTYRKLHPDAEEVELVKPAGLPPLEKQIRQIEALGEPTQDASQIEAWISEFEAALNTVRKKPASIIDLAHTNPFQKADKLAEEYGFKYCDNAP